MLTAPTKTQYIDLALALKTLERKQASVASYYERVARSNTPQIVDFAFRALISNTKH